MAKIEIGDLVMIPKNYYFAKKSQFALVLKIFDVPAKVIYKNKKTKVAQVIMVGDSVKRTIVLSELMKVDHSYLHGRQTKTRNRRFSKNK